MSKLGERVWWWWRATTMALALSPKFTDHSARARLDWLSLSSLVATPLEEAESELKPKAFALHLRVDCHNGVERLWHTFWKVRGLHLRHKGTIVLLRNSTCGT